MCEKRRLSVLLSAALILCALCLALVMSACGGDADPENADTTEQTTPAGTDPATDPVTEPITEPDTIPETESETETEPVTEPETEHVATAPYYLCRFTGDLENGVEGEPYDKLDDAVSACKKKAYLGLRVCDAAGYPVFFPYTELQCDLLREAKWVTDYVRENKFRYGDAPINPAINCDAKKVSCDRLVCWVYYRVGFTDQPRTSGLVVSNFFPWCEKMGFEKITRVEDLQPGDLVGVRPSSNKKYPEHVFMFAGTSRYGVKQVAGSSFLRYDCGSDTRIQSKQPFNEPINDFMLAYRPVAHEGSFTKLSTGENKPLTLSIGCLLYVQLRDAEWTEPDGEKVPDYNYEFVLDGVTYRFASGTGDLENVETGKVSALHGEVRSDVRTFLREAFPTA